MQALVFLFCLDGKLAQAAVNRCFFASGPVDLSSALLHAPDTQSLTGTGLAQTAQRCRRPDGFRVRISQILM